MVQSNLNDRHCCIHNSPTHGGFRQWEGHEVKSSETMVGIALKYDITVEDIRRCNNLWTNDSLWPGQVSNIF